MAAAAAGEYGMHFGRTIDWVDGFDSNAKLVDAIKAAWRRSRLPLHDLAGRIERVSVACSTSGHSRVGVLVWVAGRPRPYYQRAPQDWALCEQVVSARQAAVGASEVVDLFAAAPHFMPDEGVALAVPEFLESPIGTMAQALCGAGWTVEQCLRADLSIPDPAAYMELAWRPPPGRIAFICVDTRGTLYLYDADDELPGVELDLSIQQLIQTCFEDTVSVFEVARSARVPKGRCMRWLEPGADARRRYDALTPRDQVRVALAVMMRILEGAPQTTGWARVREVLERCVRAVGADTPIDDESLLVASRLVEERAWTHGPEHAWLVSATVFVYVPTLIVAWNTGSRLRYPRFRFRCDARARPVHQHVLEVIDRMRVYHTQADGAA